MVLIQLFLVLGIQSIDELFIDLSGFVFVLIWLLLRILEVFVNICLVELCLILLHEEVKNGFFRIVLWLELLSLLTLCLISVLLTCHVLTRVKILSLISFIFNGSGLIVLLLGGRRLSLGSFILEILVQELVWLSFFLGLLIFRCIWLCILLIVYFTFHLTTL